MSKSSPILFSDPLFVDVCNPSPCGPNSNCRDTYGQAVCSCIPGFSGVPPTCRPECVVSSDCPRNRACNQQKCIDPCPGSCGLGAECAVINHNPICSCPPRYTGNPFQNCVVEECKNYFSTRILLLQRFNYRPTLQNLPTFFHLFSVTDPKLPENPCQPSPCGPNAQCRVLNNQPSCSCDPEFVGVPPRCRPECVSNSECPSNQACINQKCRDPCPGSCGSNTECNVISHTPMCSCAQKFTGNPFVQCSPMECKKKSTSFSTTNIIFIYGAIYGIQTLSYRKKGPYISLHESST